MSKYDIERNEARNDIIEAGASAILRKVTLTENDPLKPWIQNPSTTQDYSVHILFIQKKFDGEPILPENQSKVLLVFDSPANDNISILTNDQIILGSSVFDVVSNNALQPDAIPIYHELVLKK
jgi:hypothetical protein